MMWMAVVSDAIMDSTPWILSAIEIRSMDAFSKKEVSALTVDMDLLSTTIDVSSRYKTATSTTRSASVSLVKKTTNSTTTTATLNPLYPIASTQTNMGVWSVIKDTT